MDTIARLYGENLSQALGKPVVVENKPGAAMMLDRGHRPRGARRSDPAVAAMAPMAVNQMLYKKLNYDPDKDFIPIYLYAKSPFVLVVDPALNIGSVQRIDRARQSQRRHAADLQHARHRSAAASDDGIPEAEIFLRCRSTCRIARRRKPSPM